MEELSLRIHYFDKESFLKSYNRWKNGKNNHEMIQISPLDQSWNHFFKPKVIDCVILDRFELKTANDKILNTHSIYVLQDDLLWMECVPFYENGTFININTTNLYSISSLKEASETYKNIFKDKYKNNFGEDLILNKLFIILNRELKLKEIGI